MKKLIFLIFPLLSLAAMAQDNSTKPPDLAVPTSPAFIITDITPTLVQSPNTPKAFVLGIAQSYQQSGGGFPDNYAAEFAPYWWINAGHMTVYDVQGIKTTKDAAGRITGFVGEDAFSGLRFTSLSVAFVNKDMIPDTAKLNQKIVSIGIRSTILKVHAKGYAQALTDALQKWHDQTKKIIESDPQYIAKRIRLNTQAQQDSLLKSYQGNKIMMAPLDDINKLLMEKPLFSWDVAAAYAQYGVNDQKWKSGRTGIWTTVSTYLPIAFDRLATTKAPANYLNLNFLLRYQDDQFYQLSNGTIGPNRSLDIGFNAALDFNQLSVGVESLYRSNNGLADSQNRTVGVINFKLSDSMVLTGTFGKNFNMPDKLIAGLGINWGISKENIKLPAIQ